MILGNIAIPSVDPKTWRSRGRKKGKQPVLATAIVTPSPMKKRMKGSVIRLGASIIGPAPDDYDPEEHRRRGALADELFREIVRRLAAKKRDALDVSRAPTTRGHGPKHPRFVATSIRPEHGSNDLMAGRLSGARL